MTCSFTPTEEKEIPPEAGQETISQVLTLVDAEYKKITFDSYGIQMSNARNYLWLFFLVLSFCIAFFKESELGNAFLRCLNGSQISWFFFPTLAGFITVMGLAVMGFWLGIRTISQTNIALPYEDVLERLTDLECDRFQPLETYQFKKHLLERLHFALTISIQMTELRGNYLRNLSRLFKYSLIGILITLVLYGGTFLS